MEEKLKLQTKEQQVEVKVLASPKTTKAVPEDMRDLESLDHNTMAQWEQEIRERRKKYRSQITRR